MILVDTSVWIDFFNGHQSPENAVFHRLLDEEEEILLTGLIYAEILQGIRTAAALQEVKERLQYFTILEPASTATYEKAAEIYRLCRRGGRTIRSMIDCVIAAVAIENKIPILARDRDYEAIARHLPLKFHR